MRILLASLAIFAALPALRAHAEDVVIHADQVLRGVPSRFLGANFTSQFRSGASPKDFAPCCLNPLSRLPRPLSLWRTPGGALGAFFHFLTGTYSLNPDDQPGGVTLDRFAQSAAENDAGLLHILNWNATDQELVNLIDYANGTVPSRPNPAWTMSSYKQQDAAPNGYFPWLRSQRRGTIVPIGLRYVELGNEIYNDRGSEPDMRCNHVAACYGKEGPKLGQKLRALDQRLQIGVSILTLGPLLQSTNPAYKNPAIYAGWQAASAYPDFVSDHVYFRCGYGPHDPAGAEAMVRFADKLSAAAETTRGELMTAFPQCGAYIGMFLDTFGPQACGAGGPEPFESFTPWGAAATAHVYAAALHNGYTHVSYNSWNGDPQHPDAAGFGLVGSDDSGTVDANFWGLWLVARLLDGAVSELGVSGLPADLRGFAVHAGGLIRLLLINTSSTTTGKLSVSVAGRTVNAAVALGYPADGEHGDFTNLFARRSDVPQIAPAVTSQMLREVTVRPLSTLLLEIDVGDARAPSARAAATGCMLEDVAQVDSPDLPSARGDSPSTQGGCSCDASARRPRSGAAPLGGPVLFLFLLLYSFRRKRRQLRKAGKLPARA